MAKDIEPMVFPNRKTITDAELAEITDMVRATASVGHSPGATVVMAFLTGVRMGRGNAFGSPTYLEVIDAVKNLVS